MCECTLHYPFDMTYPGIIQNAESEVVKLVEDLVISHIKGNCLILVALPMTGIITYYVCLSSC